MPSSKNNNENNFITEEELERQFDAGTLAPINTQPVTPFRPAGGPPAAGNGAGQYGSGPLPPNFGLATDLAATEYPSSTAPIRLMPVGPAGNPQINSAIKSVSTLVVNEAIAAIPVIPAPISLNAGNGIQINSNVISLKDPLVHGNPVGEIDPAAIVLQDEFNSGTTTTGQIGSLGWEIPQQEAGGSGALYTYVGGGFPYLGEFCIAANSVANTGSTLIPNFNAGATNPSRTRTPFVEYPSWKMIWIFRYMPNMSIGLSAGFDLTNRAMYIGLGIESAAVNNLAQRPFNFVGLRFDQDTTAPSIGDTTFKFESLQNGAVIGGVYTRTSTNGVNNQGGAKFNITSVSCTSNVITVTATNTLQANSMVTFSNMTTSTFLNGVTANVVTASSTSFTINFAHANFSATSETGTATLGGSVTDTGITPVIGQYYRFEMSCSTVGQVSMSLSNGTTTFTATGIEVPQYSFDLASTWTFGNDFTGEFFAENGPIVGPFGTGSVLTFSNFTSTAAAYNGSQTVFDSDDTVLHFLTNTSTGAVSSVTGTIAGYPSHFIQASFGTTTSGSGTTHCALHIDFFSFAWNPGVNGGTGTPNSVKPRYW